MNVRFEYLYRDAGNFKQWGEVIFANKCALPTNLLVSMAESVLIDGRFFVAAKADVEDLHFEDYNDDLDHGWHEVHSFQVTDEKPTDTKNRDIVQFIESLRAASAI